MYSLRFRALGEIESERSELLLSWLATRIVAQFSGASGRAKISARPWPATPNRHSAPDLSRYLLGLTHMGSCRSEVLRPGGLRKSPPG
jgi:hypothetical protein